MKKVTHNQQVLGSSPSWATVNSATGVADFLFLSDETFCLYIIFRDS